MIMLFVDNIAYILADGNYTKICYIGGLTTVLSLGISKIEAMLSRAYPKGTISPFIRLGRSVIINQMFRCRKVTFPRSTFVMTCKSVIYNVV